MKDIISLDTTPYLTRFRIKIILSILNNASKKAIENIVMSKELHNMAFISLKTQPVPIWYSKLCEFIYDISSYISMFYIYKI